ncbi:Uncharacterized protein ALO40_03026 [Pseudomonas syringae pv. viburni]|uniref:Uncharacterized protein n=1 Tax=Pseudomonas syringae pv. viburni TaxID=251703 RepID=A0A0Q0GQ31_9PSED|nr:Uncharacterized protein ALO40_03026 [Pseudomonas syringae pv. viburni]
MQRRITQQFRLSADKSRRLPEYFQGAHVGAAPEMFNYNMTPAPVDYDRSHSNSGLLPAHAIEGSISACAMSGK